VSGDEETTVSDLFNEYQMRHLEGRREQLLAEARQERLKAEVVKAARQQKQSRPVIAQPPNLLMRLRAVLRSEPRQPMVQDCTQLESTTP
jgi:hypothetical protein